MSIDPDLEAVQTLLSFSRGSRQQEVIGDTHPAAGSSSDESQDQWDSSSDDNSCHKTHLQSAKVSIPLLPVFHTHTHSRLDFLFPIDSYLEIYPDLNNKLLMIGFITSCVCV